MRLYCNYWKGIHRCTSRKNWHFSDEQCMVCALVMLNYLCAMRRLMC